LVFFPSMHAELVPAGVPEQVRLLDPGAAGSDQRPSPRYWRPEGLPLDAKQSSRFLAESLGFGERFQKPSDLHYFVAAELEDYYSQTSMSIRTEFMRESGLKSHAAKSQDPDKQGALQAQMALLLAWRLEESLLEYRQLNQGVNESWGRFRRIIGLEDDDSGSESVPEMPAASPFEPSDDLVPWPQLLVWFACVLEPEDALVVCDGHILDEWYEDGLSLEPLSEKDLGGYGLDSARPEPFEVCAVRAPAWRLARLSGPEDSRPWLSGEITVIGLREKAQHNTGSGHVF